MKYFINKKTFNVLIYNIGTIILLFLTPAYLAILLCSELKHLAIRPFRHYFKSNDKKI